MLLKIEKVYGFKTSKKNTKVAFWGNLRVLVLKGFS